MCMHEYIHPHLEHENRTEGGKKTQCRRVEDGTFPGKQQAVPMIQTKVNGFREKEK